MAGPIAGSSPGTWPGYDGRPDRQNEYANSFRSRRHFGGCLLPLFPMGRLGVSALVRGRALRAAVALPLAGFRGRASGCCLRSVDPADGRRIARRESCPRPPGRTSRRPCASTSLHLSSVPPAARKITTASARFSRWRTHRQDELAARRLASRSICSSSLARAGEQRRRHRRRARHRPPLPQPRALLPRRWQ